MEWLIASAHAQAAGGAQPNALLQMLPLLLIFVVFYFLLIRPQAKRAQARLGGLGKPATSAHLHFSAVGVKHGQTVL